MKSFKTFIEEDWVDDADKAGQARGSVPLTKRQKNQLRSGMYKKDAPINLGGGRKGGSWVGASAPEEAAKPKKVEPVEKRSPGRPAKKPESLTKRMLRAALKSVFHGK
jgi:hypothetical protein